MVVEVPAELQQSSVPRRLFSWLGIRAPSRERPEVGTVLSNVTTTGFSSDEGQTDSSPCITASGKWVRAGTVASNFLPLGTLLKIREVGGREFPGIYIVEDRMAYRFSNRIDIWFAQTSQALDFGKRQIEIVVVGYGKPGQSLAQAGEEVEIAGTNGPGGWEAVKLRARSIAAFLTTRGQGVDRNVVDCLALQQAELEL